jgi:serine/threonine protein kinase
MVVQGNETVEEKTYARIEHYFLSALAMETKDRMAWLDHVLCDDITMLQEVKLLLNAHQASDTFLQKKAPVKETIDEITTRCPDLTGRRLGVYEIIGKIAKGGMGRIYSAKRVDGEYEQVVAIKVVEFANLETSLFQKERQLLADIQHPNIVTLLDGGRLPEGFPYLVMELVEGAAIDHYVKIATLTTDEIVTLCAELCGVVEDAHQLGIIHCDLKPDNILVMNKRHRKGLLKLLDFGIARSLSASNSASNKKSDLQSVGLTPEYASPQRHCHHTPCVADDVFSLGVILGQLLSGQSPVLVRKTSLTKKNSKVPDIKALIRPIENKELVQIIHKAISSKPDNRYHTAKDFQNDLQNWLEEKPVEAAQGGFVYFYSKYIYRYRTFLFTITTLALIALMVGQMTGQYYEYQESSGLREHNAIEAVSDLNSLLLDVPYTPSLEKEVTTLTLKRLQDWNKETPKSHIIKNIYANVLIRMGNVSGHPYYLNVGKPIEARDYYQKALGLYDELAVLGRGELDEAMRQAVVIKQRYISHRLLELQLYVNSDASSAKVIALWEKMRAISETLDARKFVSLSSEQRLLVISMLLAEAYESLRIKASSATTKALLLRVKKMLLEGDVEGEIYAHDGVYLTAFYYEIIGHFYYLQGNVNTALSAYSKIERFKGEDERLTGRYRYLLNRVDSAFACLGYQQKSSLMKAQHFKYFEYANANLNQLVNEYHDVPFLRDLAKRMKGRPEDNKSTGQRLFCAKPLRFLLPPLSG